MYECYYSHFWIELEIVVLLYKIYNSLFLIIAIYEYMTSALLASTYTHKYIHFGNLNFH